MPNYNVEVAIRSGDGDIVATQIVATEASSEEEAVSIAVTVGHEHPCYDERIDPIVDILDVQEVDDE